VTFKYKLSLLDESLANAYNVKLTCAQHIQTALNTRLEWEKLPIANMSATTGGEGVTCGAATYDLLTTAPVFNYECLGHRRYGIADSKNVCCK